MNNNVRRQNSLYWNNSWAIACHMRWYWRNKEKHDVKKYMGMI
jgi:hypothetical protein